MRQVLSDRPKHGPESCPHPAGEVDDEVLQAEQLDDVLHVLVAVHVQDQAGRPDVGTDRRDAGEEVALAHRVVGTAAQFLDLEQRDYIFLVIPS